MPRVKRGSVRSRKRNSVLKHTKGFKWRRKSVYRIAVDAMRHALVRSYQGRKQKKRDKRALWQIKINAAARENGTTYGALIHSLKTANVELNRKMLAELAEENPKAFASLLEQTKK